MRTLPPDVARLLRSHVDTFEKLAVVRALHASSPAPVALDKLSELVRLPGDVLREALAALCDAGLVRLRDDLGAQLVPESPEYPAVTTLARLCDSDHVGLVDALGKMAMDRLRTLTSEALAKALVGRDKPGP